MVMAACGQKPGVAEQFSGGALPPGATVDPETGQIIDAEGNVIGSTGEGGLDTSFGSGTGGTGSGTSSGSGTGTGSGSGTGTGTGSDPNAPAPTSGDTTGVTNDSIKIGSHAPLTGAAPVPSDSAQKGSDLLWKWMEQQKQTINGRGVEAILKNDNYNPSQAVAVCKEMVEKDKVFLLSGLAGTDQIQACARYAASVGVPYLSAGVTEIGLTGLPNYFATSMTYADQGPLLVDYMISKLGAKGEKNGMLRFDTPNFEDAHDAFISAARSKGLQIHYDRAVCKCATSTEAQTVVQEMSAAGIDNVFVLVSPVWWLQVLQAARTQQYTPQWTGVGITKTFDTVATVGCRNGTIDKSKFFSPFPAWIDIKKYDNEFTTAVRAIYNEDGDDFIVLGWAGSKVIRELLLRAGKNLSREGFVYSSERAKNVKTGTFPTLNFAPDDRFGASSTLVSEARCSDARWHVLQTYSSDF
jgi:ABC-type branched-subunit amino acid transport system substrate-binding protein